LLSGQRVPTISDRMHRAQPHPNHGPTRCFLGLSLVLALAALTLSPAVARAESSSEKVYHLAPPTAESTAPEQAGKSPTGNHPGPHATPETHHSAAVTSEESTTGGAPAPEGDRESKERHRAEAAPPSEAGNQPPRGKSGPGEGAPSKGSDGPGPDAAMPPGTNVPRSSGGGGSSPAIPILIAVVVLAAVSIGVLLYRERTQGGPAEGDGPRLQ
jgi:hypothetical protein